LHERTGFRHRFPRRSTLAGRKPDDGITDAPRFARLHLKITGFAVALVQKGDGGDAFGHWRHIVLAHLHRCANDRLGGRPDRDFGGWRFEQPVANLHPANHACPEERGDHNEYGDDPPARHASGVHAS